MSGARLVLPAVPGRPGVVYFTVHNDSPAGAVLVSIRVQGVEQLQMHRTEGGTMQQVRQLRVMSGGTLDFMPGGLHVMAFGLSKALVPGGSSQMAVTFADGGKFSVPIAIESMGSNAAPTSMPMGDMKGMSDHDMPGMQH